MLGQVTHQALYRLVFHHTDTDESGVLQARSEEVDTTGRPVKKGNVNLPEIMLAKFSGQALETNQWLYFFRTKLGHQSVQGGLASLIARFPDSAKDLQRGQIGFLFQNLYNDSPEILHDAGSANPPLLSLGGIIDMNDWGFFRNALNRAQGNFRQTGHFGLGVTCLQQNLDFVTL